MKNKRKLKTGEFIALSASTMMLTALAIDIMLPSFASVREHFGLPDDSTETAKIISFFFMGQVAQIIFGALSDRYGRLSILRIGFPLYIIGGIIATFAPSLTVLLVARFIAGMGASAVFMTTIAGVRDRFVGNQMARIMSLILTIFLFTPVLAPFLGVYIMSFASWQAVFITPVIVAVIVFLWSLRLEESLPREQRIPLDWKNIVQSAKTVMSNRTFLRYTAITTILFTVLSSYVASSEHIIGEIYHRPEWFAWIFGGMGLFLSFCTLLNSRLSARYGARRVMKWLLSAYALVAGVLLICTFAEGDPPRMLLFFVAVGLMLGINLAVEPNSSSLALEPLGEVAGMASSIYGTSFFFFGATLGAVISRLLKHGVFPLVVSFFVLGLVTVYLVFSDIRPAGTRAISSE
jgi:DHA1 family bicyclomycin/chloramphenicol resistance-like MFS transporter